jgi:hypothetical protein
MASWCRASLFTPGARHVLRSFSTAPAWKGCPPKERGTVWVPAMICAWLALMNAASVLL